MSETQSRGYWIKIPDHNGYDKTTFNQRIAPHLSSLGMSTFTPASAKLIEIETDGAKRKTEREATSTEFGVVVTTSGTGWAEIYQIFDRFMPVLKELYGLETIEAPATYAPNYEVNFTRKISSTSKTSE